MLTSICHLTFLTEPPSLADIILTKFARIYLPLYQMSADMLTAPKRFSH